MTTATRQKMSVQEFEREYLGKRAELWRGEVREYMPAGAKHGIVAARLTMRLGAQLTAAPEGEVFAAETGFIIHTPAGESVLAPDVAYIRKERLPQGELPEGYCPISPDLVVEVVSPNDRYTEVREKVGEWLAGGVQMVWVVDPQRRVVEIWRPPHELVRTLTEADTLSGDPIMPEFE
ncbi:MAG: Uma2 family endonuclease, partial [Fimbriimonadales bacterium]|nr:Uma2 family endonuclease [Fimbriimonadales bacterium]